MAKSISFTVRHQHGLDGAQARVEALGDYYRNRHGAKVTWDGNHGTIDGKYALMTIYAKVHVQEDQVHVEGRDPGALLRKKATNYLRGKFEQYLDGNVTLENLPRS